MNLSFIRICRLPLLAALLVCGAAAEGVGQTPKPFISGAGAPPVPLDSPSVTSEVVDNDGTLHFGARTVPLPQLNSPEARAAYTQQMLRAAAGSGRRGGLASTRSPQADAPQGGRNNDASLKRYPVTVEESKIGGVAVTIFAPKVIPQKNRGKVALEFEMPAEAIAIASLSQMKVIKVNYRGGGPSIPGNEDIVAVYKELLKTYKPKSIAMFGASGGCTLAATTIMWLSHMKIPLPGAVGLGTCSGGSNPGDSRWTLNGLDASLSSAFPNGNPPYREPAVRKPDEPPATALDGVIPKDYPAAFLLTGTRDMCLSETVVLHQKLRDAGVETELNVFEGMWHFFWQNPDLPESQKAMAELSSFFDRHLQP